MKGYTIRQLRKQARQYAINNNIDSAFNEDWCEFESEYWAGQMMEAGFDASVRKSRQVRSKDGLGNIETKYYDDYEISWDQYFYVSFGTLNIDIEKMNIPAYNAWKAICTMRGIPQEVSYSYSGRYVEHDYRDYDELSEDENSQYCKLNDSIAEAIKDLIDDWKGKIGNGLEETYNGMYEDDYVMDYLEANEVMFNYKGERI